MPRSTSKKSKEMSLQAIKDAIESGDVPEIKPLSTSESLNQIRPASHKPIEFEGQDLILYGLDFQLGNFGDYYTLLIARVSDPQDLFEVTSGGQTLKAQLNALEKQGVEYPIGIRFGHTGNQAFIIFS